MQANIQGKELTIVFSSYSGIQLGNGLQLMPYYPNHEKEGNKNFIYVCFETETNEKMGIELTQLEVPVELKRIKRTVNMCEFGNSKNIGEEINNLLFLMQNQEELEAIIIESFLETLPEKTEEIKKETNRYEQMISKMKNIFNAKREF